MSAALGFYCMENAARLRTGRELRAEIRALKAQLAEASSPANKRARTA